MSYFLTPPIVSDADALRHDIEDGTIRLWQTNPGKSYGLWQGVPANGG